MIAQKSKDEEQRLSALYGYDILDSPEEQAFDDITRLIAYICDAPVAIISLVDRDRQFFKSEVGLGVRETPLDVSICAHAILQPGLFIVPDTTQDPRFADNPLVTGDPNLRFYAGALLETPDGDAIGSLCVLDYKTRHLTEDQRAALQALARQVMALMELRRRYAHEKNIAETLQRSMLMRPAENQFPGLLVETLYEAASKEAQVGGDFFDIFALPSGRVALVVGDVAGKGLGAATRTAEVKYALRVYLRESSSPAEAVARLNAFLTDVQGLDDRGQDGFVVLAVAVVDPDGTTLVTIAGAESPIIARADGSLETVSGTGLPLGVMSDATYTETRLQLQTDDLLLLLTDGITEARSGREFFGIEGVIEVVRSVAALPSLQHIGTVIVDAARGFGQGVLRDDVCLLLARRT